MKNLRNLSILMSNLSLKSTKFILCSKSGFSSLPMYIWHPGSLFKLLLLNKDFITFFSLYEGKWATNTKSLFTLLKHAFWEQATHIQVASDDDTET